jgi:F-type H+-transporting ATPase subunit gamma
VKSVRLLPFNPESDPNVLKNEKEVEYEPSMEDVFNYLVPKYVETMLYSAIVESATCEHAARRMAMENATDNAREMLGELELNYNRARQTAITNQLIEIVSGSEAQK